MHADVGRSGEDNRFRGAGSPRRGASAASGADGGGAIGKTDFNGTNFAGKNLGELTSGLTANVEGTNVVFGGTVNHVPDWTEFSAAEEDRTGYYAAFEMKAADGSAFVRQTLGSGEKTLVFGQTGDGPGAINLVAAIQKDVKEFTATLYASAEDAESKTDGTEYTFDFTACVFGE